ncbi:MAG: hypothetical protein LBC25_01370 [Holosporales bacterium]|jgi:hypothetical protein|nr:hypothetical protein [Holosporales bacterium]
MNVKCPYCGCCYDIQLDVLKNPIGNERLGYGWWLRCFRCKKKWWLKKSDISLELEKSIKANRSDQIAKISKLNKKRRGRARTKPIFLSPINCILIVTIILTAVVVFYHRDVFTGYLIERAKRLSKNTRQNITMSDVRYNVSKAEDNEGFKVFVTGIIKNDDNAVAKLRGVKITIFDGENEIKSWNSALQCDYIVPKDSLSFSTENMIDKTPDDIRVEVSIF